MSDLEVLKAMLDRAGIKYSEANYTGLQAINCPDHPQATHLVQVDADIATKNHGYMGFFTKMYFTADTDGALVCMGVWE